MHFLLAAADLQTAPALMVFVSLVILSAFICGRITGRLGLGEASGQILGGLLTGPLLQKLLGLIQNGPAGEILMRLVSDEALKSGANAMIFFLPLHIAVSCFSLTEETHRGRLADHWRVAVVLCLFQTAAAGILTGSLIWLIFDDAALATIAALLAIATSPCAPLMSLVRHEVEGRVRSVWGQCCLFESVVETAAFLGLAFYTGKALQSGEAFNFSNTGTILFVVAAISALGFWILRFAVRSRVVGEDYVERSGNKRLALLLQEDRIPSVNILISVWTAVGLMVGLSMIFKISFLLPVLICGIFVSNLLSHYVFDSLKLPDLSAFMHVAFFGLAGSLIPVSEITWHSLAIGLVYIGARAIGKIAGSHTACSVIDTDRQHRLRTALPYLSLPNLTPTVIGFAALGSQLSGPYAEAFKLLLPGIVIGEIITSAAADIAARRWKTRVERERAEVQRKDPEQQGEEEKAREILRFPLESLLQSRVIVDINVKTREDAIRMLCAELGKSGAVAEPDAIAQQVIERESIFSTALGDEMALPHCRAADVDYPIAIAALLPFGESLDWDSPDGLGIRTIFLLVTPAKDPDAHIEAMKCVSLHLARPGFLEDLRRAAIEDRLEEYLHSL
ncbi:MAG: hypothetical protein RL095_3876 [Verrucomicrobiota bacterium]|jgi:mannitol/fructose-specific phosphotransferase system IIA component (Ntr-type)